MEKTSPECNDLGRNPAQIGNHDGDTGQNFHRAVITLTVVVADGQQVQLVQFGRKKHAHQNQAHAGAKRIFDDTPEAVLHEFGGNAQHGFRAEPGCEHRGGDDIQRQVTAGDHIIPGRMNPGGGIQADADGNQKIERDKPHQHGGCFHVLR